MQDSLSSATQLPRSLADNVRKRVLGKTPDEVAEEKVLADAERIWAYLSSARKRAEYEWWLNDQFYQGEQYVSYNFSTNRIERPTGASENRLIINKINSNAKFVVGWLNREHPQSKVLPGVEQDEAYVRAKKQEHLLDYWYDKLQLNKKTKQVTLDAFKYKLGWFKVLWDHNALAPTTPYRDKEGSQKASLPGELMVERVDPFEVYFDPMAHEVKDMRFIIHAIPRTLGELKANKHYTNRDKLSSDSKLAASYMKEAQMRSQTVGAAQFTPTGGSDHATVIVKELFQRKTNPDTGMSEVWVTTFTSTGVLLRNEVWPMGCMPWVLYTADVQGSLLEGGGPLRHMRSPQKALNQLNSIIQENARVMGKIQMRMPRGSNVSVIDDEVGSFIEYDATPGGVPEQVSPAGLPAYMPNHLDRLEKYLDDLGGNHNASYGRSPGSKASGELVNKLQEGDSHNLTMMSDNLDDALMNLYKLSLHTFKKNAKADRMIRLNQTDAIGQHQFVKVTADDISLDDEVKVKSGSNMPYSLADKQELYLNLYKEKAIDAKLLLKALEMPDLDNQMGSQQMDIERAVAENKQMLDGVMPANPVKGEDHAVHMEAHTQLIKSELFAKADLPVKNIIMSHYDKHIDLNYQLTQISNSLNVDPIKRSETFMVRTSSLNEFTPTEATQFESKFGVQSDRLLIQSRGGVAVTDPAMAEQQAQAEDMQLMDGTPVPISVADNHQVHIETHTALTEDPRFESAPPIVQQLVDEHIKDHLTALKAQQQTPGLVPPKNFDNPNKPQVLSRHDTKPEPPKPGEGDIQPDPVSSKRKAKAA